MTNLTDEAPASERQRLRQRANQIQRAIAAVQLAVDGLGVTDRLIVLNDALSEALRDDRYRERDGLSAIAH